MNCVTQESRGCCRVVRCTYVYNLCILKLPSSSECSFSCWTSVSCSCKTPRMVQLPLEQICVYENKSDCISDCSRTCYDHIYISLVLVASPWVPYSLVQTGNDISAKIHIFHLVLTSYFQHLYLLSPVPGTVKIFCRSSKSSPQCIWLPHINTEFLRSECHNLCVCSYFFFQVRIKWWGLTGPSEDPSCLLSSSLPFPFLISERLSQARQTPWFSQ